MRRLVPIFGLLLLSGSLFAQSISNGASLSNGATMRPPVGLCVILTNSLPPGTPGVLYDQTISVTIDCQTPFVYSVFTGVFPPWATLNPATGEISGIAAPGTYNFVLQLQDGTGNAFFSQPLTISTPNGGGGGGGGVGDPLLPDSTLVLSWDTTEASNPSSGPVRCVEHAQFFNPGGVTCDTNYNSGFPGNIIADLNSALTDPPCGTRIFIANLIYVGSAQLDEIANATQNCAGNWIVISRDRTDPTFAPEGQRVDPSYAGLPQTAFPGLPYPTGNTNPNNTVRHMPKIITTATSNTAPFHFRVPTNGNGINAASYVRLEGLELARDGSTDILTVGGVDLSYAPSNPGQDCAVTLNGSGSVDKNSLPVNAVGCMNVQPHDIILDRIFVDGDAQRQTTRGINFGGARRVAFIDSWGSGIQLTSGGGGGDAQFYFAGGGHGFTNVGLYKILNNETSSSSEGSIFCGAFTEAQSPATGFDGVPHDVWFGGGNAIIKDPHWDPMLGQTLAATEPTQTIDGVVYPAAPDALLSIPPSVTLAVNQAYTFPITWINDTFGGFNTMGPTTQGVGGGSISVCDNTGNNCVVNGNTTIGAITRVSEHNVGSGAWVSANQRGYVYTAPASIGTHVVTVLATTQDSRLASLGTSRTLPASMTVTVVASNPTKAIYLAPNATGLRMPPSYPSGTLGATDAAGNYRQFCYTMIAYANYTNAALTWAVDGTTSGTSTIGTITTPTGVGTNEAVYCSADSAHQGTHSITATDGTNTVTSPATVINVSATAPILGYDLKPMNVKNAFECKCVSKLLFENNYVENAWGSQGNGGGQPGTAMLFQSVNQANQLNDGNGVPVGYGPGYVNNATMRNNYFRHMGGGFVFVALDVALGMHNILLTGNVCDDCNYQRNGNGFLRIVEAVQSGGTASKTVLSWTSASNPLACNVAFTHNTVIGLFTSTFTLQNYIAQFPLCGYKFQDNIIASGGLAATSTIINANGEANDANQGVTEPLALQGQGWNPIAFTSCKTPALNQTWYCNVLPGTGGTAGWNLSVSTNTTVNPYAPTATPPGTSLFSPSYIWDHNELIDSTESAAHFNCGGGGCDSSHPLWQLDHTAAKFVSYSNGLNGDYRLCTIALCGSNSPFAAGQSDQASDGSDLGAPVATDQSVVTNALSGTRTP